MAGPFVYVCGYSEQLPWVKGTPGKGIEVFSLDGGSGALVPVGVHEVPEPNITYLCTDQTKRFLYAVSEVYGERTGRILAFAISPDTGRLTFLNSIDCKGTGCCFVAPNAANTLLFCANYGSGSVLVARRDPETGRLGEVTSFVELEGHSGVNAERQEAPHAHHAVLSPGGEGHLLVPDLGSDQVYLFRVDHEAGTLTPAGSTTMAPGCGPRHIVFHPTLPVAFCNGEMASTITAFAWDPTATDAEGGALKEICTRSTLPEGYKGAGSSTTAAVRVSADGCHLYVTNRGHDSVTAFKIDAATGALGPALGHTPSGGQVPRDLWLHGPTVAFAANQDTGSVVTLRRDPASGLLSATDVPPASAGCPACVLVVD